MKTKFYSACVALITIVTLSSCSNDDSSTNTTTQNNIALVQAPEAAVNRGIPTASHKLIFENNTSSKILLFDIFALGAPNGPGENNLIHFKGTETQSIMIDANQTVTYNTIAAVAPESMAIPYWHVQSEAGHLDVIDTAAKVLSTYGTQVPNATTSVRYTYWTGLHLRVLHGDTPYASAAGNLVSTDAEYLGAMGGFNNVITYSEPNMTPVTLSWVPQSNGDIKVICN